MDKATSSACKYKNSKDKTRRDDKVKPFLSFLFLYNLIQEENVI